MHPNKNKPLDLHLALEGKRESHTLRLPPQASELLKEHAEAWGVSRADVVAWCLCTALAPQKHPNEHIKPLPSVVSAWVEGVGRFEEAVARFEQAIQSSVSVLFVPPRTSLTAHPEQEEQASSDEPQQAEPSSESSTSQEAPVAQPSSPPSKEAATSAPQAHLKGGTGFSGWSDAECLDYRVSVGGETKTVREWLEPLRDRDKSAHATERKNVPRLMRRTHTPPSELVRDSLQRFGLLKTLRL
jgi:hypothetical protein